MSLLLKDSMPEFSRCLTEKMLTYALGRGLQRYDQITVKELNRRLAANGYPFQTLVVEITQSLPFQSRRGELTKSQVTAKPKEIAQR